MKHHIHVVLLLLVLALSAPSTAQDTTPPSLDERLSMIKTALETNREKLHHYEWIEVTVIYVKGKQRSRLVHQCYYGDEGKLVKVPISVPPPDKRAFGLRGRIKERKKEEIKAYMTEAVDLVHEYVPPDPQRLQASRDAGHMSIKVLDPGVEVVFGDYLKPGDALVVDVVGHEMVSANLSTYLGETATRDPVTLKVEFASLDNGIRYPESHVLQAESKSLKVVVTNSGYRPLTDGP